MNIGIITVRGDDFHPTRRLREAADSRGHRITRIHPYRVWAGIKKDRPTLIGQPGMDALDVVLPRQGATLENPCLLLIHHFSLMGIPVVNRFNAVHLAKDQFSALQTLSAARIPVPDTVLANSEKGVQEALVRFGGYPVVIKRVSSRQGAGVFLVEQDRDARIVVRDHLNKKSGLLVQRFIPMKGRHDIRVLVVGQQIVGAMELVPKEGDFRANFHLSGKGRVVRLTSFQRETALAAAAALGLEIAGVDLIVDHRARVNVIEVNYSPGFRGLENVTGLDIAGRIVDYVVATYGRNKRG